RLRIDRLRLQRIAVEAIEIAAEGEVVFGPYSTKRPNELLGTTIALVVIEPMFADRVEFATEPAADHIDSDATIGQMIDCRDLLGSKGRVPRTGQQCGDDFQCRRGF